MRLIPHHNAPAGGTCRMSNTAMPDSYAGGCPARCHGVRLKPLLPGPEAARRACIEPVSWRSKVSRGRAPRADWTDDHGRGWWLPETIDRFRRDNPGRPARRKEHNR